MCNKHRKGQGENLSPIMLSNGHPKDYVVTKGGELQMDLDVAEDFYINGLSQEVPLAFPCTDSCGKLFYNIKTMNMV